MTFFVPLDSAFRNHKDANITGHEKLVERVIMYHALAGFYPAGKVLVSHTLPSLLKDKFIGDDEAFQRLRVGLGFPKGLTINFFSKIVVIDIVSINEYNFPSILRNKTSFYQHALIFHLINSSHPTVSSMVSTRSSSHHHPPRLC